MGKKAFASMNVTTGPDWSSVRDTVDLAAVATRLLGPAPGRRGERGRRLWWPCPFHEDANPSFCVEPGKPWWRCYGCDAKGDAIDLVRRLDPAMTFPEAVASLAGGPAPAGKPGPKKTGQNYSPPRVLSFCPSVPTGPEGMPAADALALVADAERRLWSPEGADALAYLRGRGLADETIGAARVGWSPRIQARTRDDRPYHARGIVLAWFDGGRPTLIKVRQPEGTRPKYAEVYRDPARHRGIYPDRRLVRPGRPLVIVEGEFDALLLGQELAELAPVVTLGSASARPAPDILGALLAAAPWFVATDADQAGEKSAAAWPTPVRRVRPPGDYKDWTEAHQGRVDLRRWWSAVLAGDDRPPLFTWEELSRWRWGDAVGDPEPGIVIA